MDDARNDPARLDPAPINPEHLEDVLEASIAALSASGDDALSKAVSEGFPDRTEVVAWTERLRAVVERQRERSVLRAELRGLAERLLRLLGSVALPEGLTAEHVAADFFARLPAVRQQIAEDVEAAFHGDPAAASMAEIVVSYPSIDAVTVHRLAHELHMLGVPLIPRMMSEQVHGLTGIDIHPGARIGRRFFIDHGTGVVIGETCVIGNGVKIYQGVTLGAQSFPRDERGRVIKGTKRHPDIEDDVTIYSGATILGPVRIGRGAIIGGNVWVTKNVPADTRIVIRPGQQVQVDKPVNDYQI